MQNLTVSNPPPTFDQARNQRQKARSAGLHPDYWYPVEYASRLKKGRVIEAKYWNQSIAVFRGKDGKVRALENRCAHRQLPLSVGVVGDDCLTCIYHGWQYDETGAVSAIPHDLFGRDKLRVRIRSYPVQIKHGLIWIFPGNPDLAEQRTIPDIPELEGRRRWAYVPIDFTWNCHHSMILENVLDFTHAFLHRGYRPFVGAQLLNCATIDDRVELAYETQVGQGRISKLFVDRKRVNTNSMTLGFHYPYQWSNTGDKIKHWCFALPIDERTTRAFFLFYFDAFRVPFTPLRWPRWMYAPFLALAKRWLIRPLLDEDGFAVEHEQRAYEQHYDAPMIEVNPVVGEVQWLTVRKWQEYLATANTHHPKTNGYVTDADECNPTNHEKMEA